MIVENFVTRSIKGTIERYRKATADASNPCSAQEINAQVSSILHFLDSILWPHSFDLSLGCVVLSARIKETAPADTDDPEF